MEFRVYYEDTDAGGVVYHARYLGFFERGRCEFLRQRGLSVRELADRGAIFPVVRMEIDFRSPAVLDDLLRVETEVLATGKTSFTLGQRVVRVADGKTLVAGRITLVCVGPGMKPRRLPETLLAVLRPPTAATGVALKASDLYYKYPKDLANRHRPKFAGKPDPAPFNRDDLYEVLPMLEAVMNELGTTEGRVLHMLEDIMNAEMPRFIESREMVFDCLVETARERLGLNGWRGGTES